MTDYDKGVGASGFRGRGMNVKPAVKITVEEYEKLLRLKKLNQELYEVVSHLSVYRDSIVPNSLIDEADKVLKKVRGEGE